MGMKLAKAMGCTVTAISRSMAKEALAREMGADFYIASSDEGQMTAAAASINIVMDTIPGTHDYDCYMSLLAEKGHLVFVGFNNLQMGAMVASKVLGIRPTGPCQGANTGGVKNTQEVVDLCARAKIYPYIELSPVHKLNEI